MEYKKHYTDNELRELTVWYEQNMERLPSSLRVDKATYVPDLGRTVRFYFDIMREHKDNPTYAAQIFLLFKIRKVLEEQWKNAGGE